MTFLTMQQELSSRIRAYDETVSDDATQLKRWLNMAIQYICGKWNWPFLIGTEIVQTVIDVTTGTVSINAAATTATFSTGPTASATNKYIKFSGANDWYRITAHTAGATTATVTPAYGPTTNLSAGTYTIRQLYYNTSTTPLVSILDIKQLITPTRLISFSAREGDIFLPLYYGTGTPYEYIANGVPDSDGDVQFSLLPSPSAVINLMVRGIKNLSDLSADGDIAVIPVRWHDGVVDIAESYAFDSLDDSRAKDALARGELRIADMKNIFSHDLGRHRIMKRIDDIGVVGPQYILPTTYGPEV